MENLTVLPYLRIYFRGLNAIEKSFFAAKKKRIRARRKMRRCFLCKYPIFATFSLQIHHCFVRHKSAFVLSAKSAVGRPRARNVEKGKKVLQSFIDADTVSGKATIIKMDLADLRSVESFVEEFNELQLPLHLLINNAGIMMPGVNKKRSKQGHELQFAVNHLGHFRLTQLLEENILSSNTVENPGRVLYLTSSGIEFWNGPGKDGLKAQIPPETRKYHPFFGYILTKAFNTLTAKEQQRRWKGKSAIAMSLNPGLVGGVFGGGGPTMLDTAGPMKGAFYGWPFAHAQRSAAYGAATTIHTALSKEVVDEVRSGVTYYNNYEATVPGAMSMHPEWFDESIAKEAWERTLKVLKA